MVCVIIIFFFLVLINAFPLELGRIEFNEFADMVADFYFKKFTRSEILEAFRRFDHNHDGFIEAHELQQIFAQLGRNFTSEEVDDGAVR